MQIPQVTVMVLMPRANANRRGGKRPGVWGYFAASIWVGSWHSSPPPHRFGECRAPHPQDRLGRPAAGGPALDSGSAGGPGCEPLPPSSGSCRSGILVLSVPCTVWRSRCKLPEAAASSVCQTDSPASGSNALAPGGRRDRESSDPEKDQWPPVGKAKARGAGERWLQAQTTGGK